MKLVANFEQFTLGLQQPWQGHGRLTLIDVFRQAPPPGQHVFQSSGTTDKHRSQSWFSDDGLRHYRDTSLFAFAKVLAAVSGNFAGGGFAGGVSLIPPVATAPASSLSQMLSWLAQQYSIEFFDTLPPTLPSGGPMFLFATALQLYALKDQRYPLPAGSIVVETGGFKGRQTAIARTELYDAICSTFGIASEHIVSEFGMCELASQAYDFVPYGVQRPLSERRFEFLDPSVRVAVSKGNGRLEAQGVGALVILDANRTDLPQPLQLEDIVKLERDGSFQLLRRNRFSPLKGCSLRFESSAVTRIEASSKQTVIDVSPILWIRDWLAFNKDALVAEFGSDSIADLALTDSLADIPNDPNQLRSAVARAGRLSGETVLLIPPNNHSLAALYPMFFALAAGYAVVVRKPSALGRLPVLQKLLADVTAKSWKIQILENRPFLSRSDLPTAVDSLICFGQETTTATIASLGLPSVLFGEVLTAAIITEQEATDGHIIGALSRDVRSLNQQGCLCTRLVLVLRDQIDDSFFGAIASGLLAKNDTQSVDLALAHDKQHARLLAAKITKISRGDNLLCFVAPSESEFVIAQTPCTLPLVAQSNLASAVNFIMRFAGTHRLAVSATLFQRVANLPLDAKNNNQIQWVRLGEANRLRWDGTYLGKSLFQEMKIN